MPEMKLNRYTLSRQRVLCAIVIVGAILISPGVHAATNFQQVVDEEFPGYTILSNEEMFVEDAGLNAFLSPEEREARKSRALLGVIEGNFNKDKLLDFAALVVKHPERKSEENNPSREKTGNAEFPAALIVCLAKNDSKKYSCDMLPTLFGEFIALPYQVALNVYSPQEEFLCGEYREELDAYYPRKNKKNGTMSRHANVPPQKFLIHYDMIVESEIGRNSTHLWLRRNDGVYIDCSGAD